MNSLILFKKTVSVILFSTDSVHFTLEIKMPHYLHGNNFANEPRFLMPVFCYISFADTTLWVNEN